MLRVDMFSFLGGPDLVWTGSLYWDGQTMTGDPPDAPGVQRMLSGVLLAGLPHKPPVRLDQDPETWLEGLQYQSGTYSVTTAPYEYDGPPSGPPPYGPEGPPRPRDPWGGEPVRHAPARHAAVPTKPPPWTTPA